MQISGVYRNCICYAGSENWYNVKAKNPLVQVANDTEAARNASQYWIWMGIFATIFMAVNCYVGWWYQMFIRRRFTEAVRNMVVPGLPAPDCTAGQASVGTDDGGDTTNLADGIHPAIHNPVGVPVAVRQSSFGLPKLRVDSHSFEMMSMEPMFSGEESRLLPQRDEFG